MVVVVAGVMGLASCTVNIQMPGSGGFMPGMNQSSSSYSHQELMFAEMMIPHHEQAVVMSDIALATSTNPEVIDLATRIRDGQGPEIDQMRSWLDQSGGSGMHHGGQGGQMGHDMGGMATDSQLRELAASVSPESDRLFLELMIEHHEGAIDMVGMIANSSNREVATLARNIVEVQRAEIIEMRALRETL
jgi:uncharacterized protein (DUF305 family)